MTREDYIKKVFETYRLVGTLSDKNDCKALHLRHKTLAQDIVLHSFPKHFEAYDILCALSFDGLPEIYDSLSLEDGQIVLEEFINGVTVAEIMETGRYRYSGVKKVLKEVCSALSVLHERGLVHRDIKPENIMIDKNGRVVLIDFNTSRIIKKASKDTVIMGTAGYASPEQLGVAQSDARTDIYAAGILINVMLTGKHPSEELAKGRPGRIVKKCTQVSPDDRYQSAKELSKAL